MGVIFISMAVDDNGKDNGQQPSTKSIQNLPKTGKHVFVSRIGFAYHYFYMILSYVNAVEILNRNLQLGLGFVARTSYLT